MTHSKTLAATLLAGAALLGSAGTATADGLPLVTRLTTQAAPLLGSVAGLPAAAGLPTLGQLPLAGSGLPRLGGGLPLLG
ncbi:hypothetical protein [Streptomyces sp. NPDC058279]|uniref:hypothetical protein n=1 Tax=Streptomyces sp. NPDC058279 TaxID=3346418 RepID=UPI0036E501CC